MAPPKKGERRHLHIDPYVYPNTSARVDKFLIWYDSQPPKMRTKMCFDVLVAAANGELGVASSVSIDEQDNEVTKKALENFLGNMVMEEED